MIALNNPKLPQFTAEELSIIQTHINIRMGILQTTPFDLVDNADALMKELDKLKLISQKLHLYWNAAVKENNEIAAHKAGAISPASKVYKLNPINVERFYIAGSVAEGWRLHDKKTDIWYSFDTHQDLVDHKIKLLQQD